MTQKRLNDLLLKITSYREEQEVKLLNNPILSWDQKQLTSFLELGLQTKMVVNNKNNKDSMDFSRLVDTNVLIIASNIVNTSCWPLALVSTVVYDEKETQTADLGTLDSLGSVWKLLRRSDAYPGTRVILQANVSA